MVPWDTYMPGDAPRYFGTPDQYADLFGFIRANARYLDAYEEAAVIGKGIKEARYDASPPVKILDSELCYAIVRAIPQTPDRPAVIHFIDWSATPKPFTVQLDLERFYREKTCVVAIAVPASYHKDQHNEAEKTRSFEALSRDVPLELAGNRLQIPPLEPWGILILSRCGN